MQLTTHFLSEELGLPIPTIGDVKGMTIFSAGRCLCQELLEPIRDHFGKALKITSGFRTAEHNKQVGGVPDSWHLYQNGRAAADFDIPGIPIEQVYDWIRLESDLKFDKIILEFSQNFGHRVAPVADIVHIQMSIQDAPRRLAYRGMIAGMKNGRDYTPDAVV